MKITGKPGENLFVVKPFASLGVNLGCRGTKEKHMPPVLKGCDVAIERAPVVTDDDDTTLRDKLTRHACLFKAT